MACLCPCGVGITARSIQMGMIGAMNMRAAVVQAAWNTGTGRGPRCRLCRGAESPSRVSWAESRVAGRDSATRRDSAKLGQPCRKVSARGAGRGAQVSAPASALPTLRGVGGALYGSSLIRARLRGAAAARRAAADTRLGVAPPQHSLTQPSSTRPVLRRRPPSLTAPRRAAPRRAAPHASTSRRRPIPPPARARLVL